MTGNDSAVDALRRRTRDHYDRYQFGFDQEEILQEKLENRVMGEAIRELAVAGSRVADVGCGACRVARLVRRHTPADTINVDLSLQSLRYAQRHDAGPLVVGDNMRLPLRTACADLVISNGVIHHTPDSRASFRELARILKPGGTLVVSVYDREGWYYWVWHYPGALIRALRRLAGDRGLRLCVFPFFRLAVFVLLSIHTRRWFSLPAETAWNLFHDQFTTPQCAFHSFDEVEGWGAEAGLRCVERRREAARQLATLRLTRPADSGVAIG